MGKFKVGDRVRLVESGDYNGYGNYGKTGEEGDVLVYHSHDNSYQVAFVDSGSWWAEESNLELAAFKIEAGKLYKTRDGRKVGPIVRNGHGDTFWKATDLTLDGYGSFWCENGRFYSYREFRHDLIAEWVDEPAVAVAASNVNATNPKFKVGDRVNKTVWQSYSPNGYVVTQITSDRIWIDPGNGMGPVSYEMPDDDFWQVQVKSPTNPAIVALIENGQPLPSVKPFIHADEASASKEAARLAAKHKGQSFGVYVLTQTVKEEVVYTYKHEWQRLAANGDKIPAIKALREITGLGLKATKDVVEYWIANDQQHSRVAA